MWKGSPGGGVAGAAMVRDLVDVEGAHPHKPRVGHPWLVDPLNSATEDVSVEVQNKILFGSSALPSLRRITGLSDADLPLN